jgi:hypothetical protein
MLVEFSTDSTISGTEAHAQQAETTVRDALGHLGEHLTRVEIHLTDLNSRAKGGPADVRCLLEARPTDHQPLAVSHEAGSADQATKGAADKLKRSLESLFGRLELR